MRKDARLVDALTVQPSCAVATRDEWLAAGASVRMFNDGRLVRVAWGLYCAPEIAADPPALVRALTERCPADAVLGGWTAAQLYGVRHAGPTMLSPRPQPVLVYLPRHEHKRPPGFHVLRVDIAPEDIETIDGTAVTSLARTAYDMAQFTRSLPDALGILDCFRWVGNPHPLDLDAIDALIERNPRHRGNPRIRRALPISTDRSRSHAESVVRGRWVQQVQVPASRILVNATLSTDEGDFELDLVDLTAGLAIEYDGPHHGASTQRSIDSTKDGAVAGAELGMLRLTSVEYGLRPAPFVRLAERRRRQALAIRADRRAAELVQSGRLVERPLRLYID